MLYRNSKGEPSALVSQHATSWERFRSTGRIDKTPVLTHRGRTLCEQGTFLDMKRCFTLAVGASLLHSSGTKLQLWRAMPQLSLSVPRGGDRYQEQAGQQSVFRQQR
jgi:hypothetical protein